jgi:hypothetical protein
MEGEEQQSSMQAFLRNLTLIGACLVLMSVGFSKPNASKLKQN